MKRSKATKRERNLYQERQAETWLISPSRGAGIRVGLVFPSPYFVGMSNLGYHVIYRMLASCNHVQAERLFYQGPEDFPRSIESDRPAADFDVLLFSCPFELDYLNLIRFLLQSHIEPLARERDAKAPLLVAGGIAVSSNPTPLARIMDAFLLGDGEEILNEALDALSTFDLRTVPRDQVLKKLSQIPGAYVPFEQGESGDKPIAKRTTSNLSLYPTGSAILTPHTELSEMFLVEVARGCVRGCNFCIVGHCQSPLRLRKIDVMIDQIKEVESRIKRVGLVASEIACHPGIRDLCEYLLSQNLEISTSSLEIDRLDRPLIDLLIKGGQKTLTLAPESGDETIRFGLNKKITDEQILEQIQLAGQAGMEKLKLYLILGLPQSSEDETGSAIRFLEKVRGAFFAHKSSHSREIILSINPFVPKPHTPWAREAMLPENEFKRRLSSIRRSAGKLGGIRISSWSPTSAALDAMISSGDASVGSILVEILKGKASVREVAQRLKSKGPIDPFKPRSPHQTLAWERFHPD